MGRNAECASCGGEVYLTGHEVARQAVPICPRCQNSEAALIPDVVGEIIAWRAWHLVRMGGMMRLKSMNSGGSGPTIWPTRRWLIAECPDNPAHKGYAPVKGCSCGIYAARDRQHLVDLRYNDYDDPKRRVVGQVAFAGKVIVGSQGWKAQKARPVHLYVPHEAWQLAEKLSATYNCPVEVSNLFTGGDE